jgi:hypothetical protein
MEGDQRKIQMDQEMSLRKEKKKKEVRYGTGTYFSW